MATAVTASTSAAARGSYLTQGAFYFERNICVKSLNVYIEKYVIIIVYIFRSCIFKMNV